MPEVRGQQERGERIQYENRDRRHNHGLCGAASDTLGADVRGVTLVGTEEGYRAPEYSRLDDAIHYLERRERQSEAGREIGARHIRGCDGGKHCCADPDRVGQDREHRQHDERGDEPRYYQIRDRIVRQRLQRIDLLRHAHRSDFGRDARANTPCQHQPRKQRPELENYRLP